MWILNLLIWSWKQPWEKDTVRKLSQFYRWGNQGIKEMWLGQDPWALISSVQLLTRVRLFCDYMDCSTPGLPVHHQLLEFTQTPVPWVGDAVPSSHPLSSPSPPAFNLSQHQGLFEWVSSSHQVAKVLEFQLQHQSFQWTPRTDFLYNGLLGTPWSPRDSQESSPTP